MTNLPVPGALGGKAVMTNPPVPVVLHGKAVMTTCARGIRWQSGDYPTCARGVRWQSGDDLCQRRWVAKR